MDASILGSILKTAISDYSRDRIAEALIIKRINCGAQKGVVEVNGQKYAWSMDAWNTDEGKVK